MRKTERCLLNVLISLDSGLCNPSPPFAITSIVRVHPGCMRLKLSRSNKLQLFVYLLALVRIFVQLGNSRTSSFSHSSVLSSRSMPRSQCKKVCKQPSIIDSELDAHFSASDTGSESDNSTFFNATTIVPQKRSHQKHRKKSPVPAAVPTVLPVVPTAVPTTVPTPDAILFTYVSTIFSAADMEKAVSKWTPRSLSFQLQSNEPWDTVKAQILVRISTALNPPILDFAHYRVVVSIPRIISKPGMPLASESDYAILLQRTSGKGKNGILVALTIIQIDTGVDKENIAPPADTTSAGKSKSKKDIDALPGNKKKLGHIMALQERWRCEKKQGSCFGAYCYIDTDCTHLPLNHDRIDVWAMSMVSLVHPCHPAMC